MAGIAAVGAINAALEGERVASEYAVRALRTQLDTAEQLGAQAVRLIDAAAIDPQTGRSIDLLV